jgi:hypothetical protein
MIEISEGMKIVEFDKYCNTCRSKDVKESDRPCSECLAEPARQYSSKPAKYEEDK